MKSFEDQTFEVILERMLSRIPDDLDKREGSVIYDAIAPTSLELAQVYHLMTIMYSLIFGETTDGEMLELRAATFGVYRKQASSAVRRGIFTDTSGRPRSIPIGSRFEINNVIFYVKEEVALGIFLLESEIPGVIGNQVQGTLIPLENIGNLGSATLTDIVKAGEEEQSDESLFEELKEKQSRPSASGNENDYIQWAKTISGIHDVKIYSQWNGPNTVKVVVTDTESRSPSPFIIKQVEDYIASVKPVGAIVTVSGVAERIVGVTVNVTLQDLEMLTAARASIAENISTYFKEIAGKETIVRYTAIGNAVLDGVGVVDYSDLKINNAASNITLQTDEVPVLGTLTVTVNLITE